MPLRKAQIAINEAQDMTGFCTEFSFSINGRLTDEAMPLIICVILCKQSPENDHKVMVNWCSSQCHLKGLISSNFQEHLTLCP